MNADAAEAWVRSRLSVTRFRRHLSRPWGTTYKVSHSEGRAWLKVVPPCLASSVAATACLSRLCSDRVPTVIDHDASEGYLLTRHHDLRDLSQRASDAERRQLLSAAARIESDCRHHSELLNLLPQHDPVVSLDDLMWFLGEPGEARLSGALVTADRFLSPGRCDTYRRLLENRLPLLRDFLLEGANLDATMSHGDLRPSNAAQDEHGAMLLYDWEEAFVGPAGSSLHSMFGGCTRLLELLDDNRLGGNPEDFRDSRVALSSYIDALADEGYAPREALEGRALASAAVSGMLRYIVNHARFPGAEDDSRYRRVVRRNLKRRFSDLLDVCDHLSVAAETSPCTDAERYRQSGREDRAERLLRSRLRLRPHDSETRLVLGRQMLARAQATSVERQTLIIAAQDHFEAVLQQGDDNAAAHEGIAECLASLARPGQAAVHLRRASEATSGHPVHRQETEPTTRNTEAMRRATLIDHLERLQRDLDDAQRPGHMPGLTFSAEEKAAGVPTSATLAVGDALFRQFGTLLIRDMFDPTLLDRCRETFLQRYQRYLSGERHDDALRIGDKRFQITIDMVAPYATSDLYAHSLLLPLMRRLLGQEVILGCFTSAMSLPGAEQQRLHKDHKALFHDDPERSRLPSFAITTMIPLVPVDERCGTTRVRKGSHRLTTDESKVLPEQTPITRLGDCYLMDYRLSHYGQANSSSHVRPILSLVYSRPWFRDCINFSGQPSLRLSADALANIPDEHRSLLDWTAEPGPRT